MPEKNSSFSEKEEEEGEEETRAGGGSRLIGLLRREAFYSGSSPFLLIYIYPCF